MRNKMIIPCVFTGSRVAAGATQRVPDSVLGQEDCMALVALHGCMVACNPAFHIKTCIDGC